MKTATIVILIPLFILSLVGNVWFYTESSNLNSMTNRQLGQYPKSYQLPHKTLSQLEFNCGKLISKNQELQNEKQQLQDKVRFLRTENRKYKGELHQIKQEARRAQELGIFHSLLQLIFSLI